MKKRVSKLKIHRETLGSLNREEKLQQVAAASCARLHECFYIPNPSDCCTQHADC